MWTTILICLGLFGFAYLVADRVEEKIKDRLDTIEDKLDTIEYALSPRQDPFDGID